MAFISQNKLKKKKMAIKKKIDNYGDCKPITHKRLNRTMTKILVL